MSLNLDQLQSPWTLPPPIAPEPIPEMFDLKTMAKLVGVKPATVKVLVRTGRLPKPIIQERKVWRWSPDQWRGWLVRKEKERR